MNSYNKIGLYLNHRWLAVFILLLTSWGLWEMSDAHFRWSGGQEKVPAQPIIYADGAAYYAYLPHWFYYDGEGYSFMKEIIKKYPDSRFDDNLGFGRGLVNGHNKYYSGTAVMLTPFFLIAHAVEVISGGQTDGYSTTYLFMVSIAAIFYWIVGAVALYLFLLRLKIPSIYAIVAILVITFGTNLFHYTIYAPTYAHVYSFACVSLLLLLAQRWINTNRTIYFLLLGLLIGMAFIIRPTNLIVLLFVPFLFNHFTDLTSRLKEVFTRKFVRILLFLVLLIIPFLLHFSNASSFNSYGDEGFDHLTDPYLFEVLFGVRRGLFFYFPVLLLALIGVIVLFKVKRPLFWGFILTFLVFTYLISSWWCWWYGGSFSMRPFVDIMPIFAIPIAFLLYRIHVVLKVFAALFMLGAVGLTQVYNYQFNHHIIHYDGMNWSQFETTFLQTGVRFEWYPFLPFDELPEEYSHKMRSIPFEKDLDLSPNYYALTHTITDSSDQMFAACITGDFKLLSSEIKPHFSLQFFKNDSVVRKEDIFFGAFIPSVGGEETIKLDVFPEIKRKEIDSLQIIMISDKSDLEVKNLTLDIYGKDDFFYE